MAEDRMALLETLRKATADGDSTSCARASGCSPRRSWRPRSPSSPGLPKGERDPERRLTHRNGYRDRRWDTRVGTIELAVPRVRDGSYFPCLLDPRRRAERALLAVVQEAYVAGVSTRRVDDLVRALGIEGISRSEVSRICAALDAEVAAFRPGRSPRRRTRTSGSTPRTSGPRGQATSCRWRPSSRSGSRPTASAGSWGSS